MEKHELLISGNEAIGAGAIYAGCKFFGGYPITPSSDLAEYMSVRLPKVGGRFIQMEDEMGSLAAVIGASIAGAKAMTATSGPGFSLMQEHIGFAVMGEIPVVIANIQRGGPSTGLPTFTSQQDLMQTRWGTHGDHQIIAVVPDSVYECFTLTVKAFNLSEKFRNPAVVLSDEVIGHMRELITIPAEGEIEIIDRPTPTVPPEEYLPFDNSYEVPPMAPYGSGYRYHITGLAHDETGFPTHDAEKVHKLLSRIVNKIENHKEEFVDIEYDIPDGTEYVVFALGSVARSALGAILDMREEGIRIGLMRPRVLWPFPEEQVKEVAEKVKAIFVVEENYKQIGFEVERAVRGKVPVYWYGKADGELITPEEIDRFVKEVLNVH